MSDIKFTYSHEVISVTKFQLQKGFARFEKDTGNPEVQIVLLQHRISTLSEHLKKNRKDKSSYRGLRCLLGQQIRMLRYLRNSSPQRYQELLEKIPISRKI